MARRSKAAYPAPQYTAASDPRTSSEAPPSSPGKRKRDNADTDTDIDWSTYGCFPGFTLARSRNSKKRKTGANSFSSAPDSRANIVQPNPVEGSALGTTYHHVQPAREWESMRVYKHFTVGQESFQIGDYVYVKPDKDNPSAPIHGWIARVLEVRAGSPEYVFIRVCWMYRPEDLPGGRKIWHGRNEVIVSNWMDIIDAKTIDSKVDVEHWIESNNDNEYFDTKTLIWRQSYDFSGEKPLLSKLEIHCVDQVPRNPDELMLECDKCKSWLHGRCIEAAAIEDAYISNNVPLPVKMAAKKKPGRRRKLAEEPPAFTADIHNTGDGATRLVVTDQREVEERSWDVPIRCLLCDHIIDSPEDSDADSPEHKIAITAPDDPPLKSESSQEDDVGSVIGVDDKDNEYPDSMADSKSTTNGELTSDT
ncbi:hypothetical protein BS50DRAFT_571024 [Corynespora cassiicola Philippines]|uniref:BAH domain-containing protein n=1 Tax=Corynespora cassiicola Philippines TaxID=1448308 RepID=A0A2T2NW63_CORCC|nr:hypothetical protein BS50DRAFT_571024 [Corynespora cassiicola Philippines]